LLTSSNLFKYISRGGSRNFQWGSQPFANWNQYWQCWCNASTANVDAMHQPRTRSGLGVVARVVKTIVYKYLGHNPPYKNQRRLSAHSNQAPCHKIKGDARRRSRPSKSTPHEKCAYWVH